MTKQTKFNFLAVLFLLATLYACNEEPGNNNLTLAETEAMALLDRLERDGGTPYSEETAVNYPADAAVYIASTLGVSLSLIHISEPTRPY